MTGMYRVYCSKLIRLVDIKQFYMHHHFFFIDFLLRYRISARDVHLMKF